MDLCRKTIPLLGLAIYLFLAVTSFSKTAQGANAPQVNTLPTITNGISTPVRLAADSSGNIYVSDPRGGGILKYNQAGNLLQIIPTLKNDFGIAIAQNGDLLVSQGSSVAVIDKTGGALLSRFGTFTAANGIAVSSAGDIYVTDSLNSCVQVFNSAYAPVNTGVAAAGKPANSFGAAGQLLRPTGISYERISNQLAVVDSLAGQVKFYSATGTYLNSIGSFGAGPLKFSSPQGIAFEYTKDGNTLSRIYVVDSFQSCVQVIDAATGGFLCYIGSYGLTGGKLVTPGDVMLNRFDALNNRLVVVNGVGALTMFGIDNVAVPPPSGPALTINSVPQATNLTALIISGTVSNGATVTVNGAAAAVNGASWSSTVNLNTGINVITVVASSVNGSTSNSVSVNVLPSSGGLPPVALTMLPAPVFTNASGITLSGTVSSGATVSINGAEATVNGTAWNRLVTLSQGINNLQIVAKNAGMSDSATSVNITLDNSAPLMTTFLPQSGSSTSTPIQSISGSVADSSATSVTVSVNGVNQTAAVKNGLFSMAVVLAVGPNAVTVTAVDAAGNVSGSVSSSITYNPLVPKVTMTSPSGGVSGSSSFTVSGTASSGSVVTVNSAPVALAGNVWTATLPLVPGINTIAVKATNPISGASSTIVDSVQFGQGFLPVAITAPAQDMATASSFNTVIGTSFPGASISATVNGVAVQTSISDNGAFSITLPTLAAPGSYAVNVTAADPFGAVSSTMRTLIYDPTVPVLSVASTTPIKLSSTGGILIAKDKNGPVLIGSVSGGVSTLDLSGASYDPTTLNIYALTPAGISSRNGDINSDGKLDIVDALKALRISVGLDSPATFQQMLNGDVGPLENNEPTVDSQMNLSDALVILRKVIGLSVW